MEMAEPPLPPRLPVLVLLAVLLLLLLLAPPGFLLWSPGTNKPFSLRTNTCQDTQGQRERERERERERRRKRRVRRRGEGHQERVLHSTKAGRRAKRM